MKEKSRSKPNQKLLLAAVVSWLELAGPSLRESRGAARQGWLSQLYVVKFPNQAVNNQS